MKKLLQENVLFADINAKKCSTFVSADSTQIGQNKPVVSQTGLYGIRWSHRHDYPYRDNYIPDMLDQTPWLPAYNMVQLLFSSDVY